MSYELQCIISGESQVRYGANIQTTISYLRASEKTSALDKTNKHFKYEETARLKAYITNHNLWKEDIDLNNYVSEGTEQKVYLNGVLYFIDTVFYLK